MADGEQYLPPCFGPYLRYAISTNFRDFVPFADGSLLFLLAEFKNPDAQTVDPEGEFEKAMSGFQIQFGPADDSTRYITISDRQVGGAQLRCCRQLEQVCRQS